MKYLTKKQKDWITKRKIKVGGIYNFPNGDFGVYSEPNQLSRETISTNPLTASLSGEFFYVKEKYYGFIRVNFLDRPPLKDYYLLESEMTCRTLTMIMILFTISFLPFCFYNAITGKYKKQTLKPKKHNSVLNKEQAKQALEEGHKIIHEYFAKGEYIRKERSLLLDENENILIESLFWECRDGEQWETGYSILE